MAVTIQDDMARVALMLPDDQRSEFIAALVMYAEFKEEPPEGAPWVIVFEAFRSRLEESHASFESGKKGGRPKKRVRKTPSENPQPKPPLETPSENPQPKPPLETPSENKKQSLNRENELPSNVLKTGVFLAEERESERKEERTKEEKKDKEKDPIIARTRGRARFKPPTPAEAEAYARSINAQDFDADRFCDFYASKGWRVGSSPMKDWRAAVRGWVRRDQGTSAQKPKTVAGGVDFAQYDF